MVQETSVDDVLRALDDLLATTGSLLDPDSALPTTKAHLEVRRQDLARDDSLDESATFGRFGALIGQSAVIKNLAEQIELVAATGASVLILGESGTGKELVAAEIHRRSRRQGQRMVKVNCASVPRDLYESEFFGHVRGAFTGAMNDRAGRFELANGGTLFLDEVGEIPYGLQGKLLRVLQEGEFERVGEEVTRRIDVRLIAATNRNLKQEIEAGRFRRDLYYRLAVFPIEVAPLRQHKEDIPLLAAHFLEHAAASFDRPLPRLTEANIIQLQQYDWPGNIRELRNVIERAVIVARGNTLHFDLAPDWRKPADADARGESTSDAGRVLSDVEMKRFQRDNLLAALRQSRWKIYGPGGAAERLGVRPTTLLSRMKKFGLEKPRQHVIPR